MGFTKSLRGFRKRKRQSQNQCLMWFNAQPDYWSAHFCWIHHYSKHLSGNAKTLRWSSIRRVPAEGCVSARRCPSTLGFDSSWLFKWNFSKPMDWKKWPNTMAAKISRYHPFRLFLVGLCKRQSLKNASTWRRNIAVTNNWGSRHSKRRNVGEHLARNWVSPWHIESNKWSTCWSLWIAWKIKFLKYGYYLNC